MIEKNVSRGIISTYFNKLERNLDLDVAIVGGGPSGIVAAYYLAKAGLKVAQFDRKLSPGGGMWGGAMMFNQIVVQEEALHIIKEFDINYEQYNDNLYVMDSVESTSALLYKAVHAGATIFNCYSVEDVIFKNDVVSGVVVNWTPVLREGMHVDPLNIMAKCVIDGTGHDSEMCRTVARKNGIRLATDTGDVIGERSLDVVSGEEEVVNGTKEIYPGLYVCGMAASAVSGTPRMGPIFGGMLMSGKKVADMIIEKTEIMRIIAITTPRVDDEDLHLIRELIRCGIDTIHLRKPDSDIAECRRLLKELNDKERERIIIHDYPELYEEFSLKGIHINRNVTCLPDDYIGFKTRSCHSFEEIIRYKDEYDYVFLSPVFDSISKVGYKAGFSMEELQEASAVGIIDEKVVALGGVTFNSVPYLKRLGFGGVAMIGGIYNADALEYLDLMFINGIR